ncbi:MAG TPA: relaxase/mobilization nuclease domain-containing protein [Candidatus Scatovivens faecipullorum]|nr:relaxase/mobilization nuclease domain-containing protein [Candidatus Scatovivens faecipullorum]
MATTKIWKVRKRLDHVINYATNEEKTKNIYSKYEMDEFDSIRQVMTYATNPDKTEEQFYTTGINCEIEDVVKQMQFVKIFYGKENGILAFHAYQSFNEGEVTPEIAHEIGVKLANEMWGDRFQVVVSTHLNTKHLHNHFVINSVSFKDGKKYYSNLSNTALLRKTSDEICEEYGLSILKEKTCKSGINFENFYKKSMRDSDYYKFAKEDIDYAIEHSWTYKEFLKRLKEMGYEVYFRANKISVRRYPHKRNIRIERAFGEEYSIENIQNKIRSRYPSREEVIKPKTYDRRLFYKGSTKKLRKPKGIIALYYYYCYLLKVYPKKKLNYKLTPEMREEVKKMDKYSEQIRFICKYKLETINDIDNLKEEKKEELQKTLNTRNRLYYKRQKLDNESAKDAVTKEIINVTSDIEKVRKEIRLCDEVRDNARKMKEQLKEMKEREQGKVKDKKSKEKKNKERRCDR